MVTGFGLNHRVQHRLRHRPKNGPSMQNMNGVTEPVLLRGDYSAHRTGSGNLEILTLDCLKQNFTMEKSILPNFLFEIRNTGVCNARFEINHQVYTAGFVNMVNMLRILVK